MSSGGGNGVPEGHGGGPVHILMFPWLAFGHISPFAQLARTLVCSGNGHGSLRVTFLTAAGNVPRVESMLSSAADAVTIHPLQLPRVPGLPAEAASTAELSPAGAELLKVAFDSTRPQVAALLASLRPHAVLFDFASPWVCGLAKPLGIKALHLSVFSAISGAFLAVPARRREGPGAVSAHDLASPPAGFPAHSSLAGGVPLYQAADFTYMFTSFGGEPPVHERVVAGIEACDGIVLKSCAEMEGPYIDYLSAQFGKPVLLAGPVVPEPPRGEELEERWATWLASFPDKSVTFASFGSETFLSAAASTELLLGLEATNRPFLIVLNFPRGSDAEAELGARIPPGFTQRVGARGVVHTGWVQQQRILRHRSVGCFVNHAGFSSVVEGIVAGCRLVMLPMKGDQYLNAALFARELKVGVEVARRGDDGWFGRDDVKKAVDAAVADGEGARWREFLLDGDVQARFAHKFVRDLIKELASAE